MPGSNVIKLFTSEISKCSSPISLDLTNVRNGTHAHKTQIAH